MFAVGQRTPVVRSLPSRGSVFSIDVALAHVASQGVPPPLPVPSNTSQHEAKLAVGVTKTILIVDDDPELRDLMEQLLSDEGHKTLTAQDASSALAIMATSPAKPDLLLADYNLPGGMNGLQLADKIRAALGQQFPVVILTGDISTATLRDVAEQGCAQLNKPVKLDALTQVIHRLLASKRVG